MGSGAEGSEDGEADRQFNPGALTREYSSLRSECAGPRSPFGTTPDHRLGTSLSRYSAFASTAARLNDIGKYSWSAQLRVRLP